jgi:ATP-binding cassette subfamily B protein
MSARTASPAVAPNNFAVSVRRMLALLGHARLTVGAVGVLALASVGLTAAGPRILGRATDLASSAGS